MGGSKTFNNIQVQGVLDEYGRLNEGLFLNDIKQIDKGMPSVLKARSTTISNMKSSFNATLMETLGYATDTENTFTILDNVLLLEYIQNNIDSNASSLHKSSSGAMSARETALIYLNNTYSDFDVVFYTFTHSGAGYTYAYALDNGASLIDVVAYKDVAEGDLTSYLDSYYSSKSSYTIDNYATTMTILNSVYGYSVDASYVEGGSTYQETVHVPATMLYLNTANPFGTHVQYVLDTYHNSVFQPSSAIYTYKRWESTDDEGGGYFVTEYIAQPPTQMGLNTDTTYDYESVFTPVAAYDVTMSVVWQGRTNFSITATSVLVSGSDFNNIVKEACESYAINLVADAIYTYVANNVEYVFYTYQRTNGSYGMGYRLKSSMPDIYSEVPVTMYPIIPLKDGGGIINSDNQRIALRNLGFEGSEFNDSLRDSTIKWASIGFSIPVSDTSDAATKLIYESLKYVTVGTVEVPKVSSVPTGLTEEVPGLVITANSGLAGLSTTIYANEPKLVVGSIGPVGTYSTDSSTVTVTVNEDEGSRDVTTTSRTYRKQETIDYYYEIVMTDANFTARYSGITEVYGSDSPECRVPIIRDVMMKIGFKDFLYLLERSLFLSIYTQVTVKVKWYQTGLFKIILIIGIIIVSLFCAACSAYLSGVLGAGAGTWAAAAWAVTSSVAVTVAVYTTMYYLAVVSLVMSLASFTLGIDFGGFGEAMGYVGMATGAVGGLTGAIEQGMRVSMDLLPSAVQLLNTYVQIANMKMVKDVEALAGQVAKQAQATQAAQDQLKEALENTGPGLFMSLNGSAYDFDSMYDVNMCYDYTPLYNFSGKTTVGTEI